MYTLILSDGTKIENLTMNGDSFVSPERLDESIFRDNLDELTIIHDDTREIRRNVEYTGQLQGVDGWYFSFADIPAQELVNKTVDTLASVLNIMMGVGSDD